MRHLCCIMMEGFADRIGEERIGQGEVGSV